MPAGITFPAPTVFTYTDNKGYALQQIPNEKISALLSRSKTLQKQLKQTELKMFASDSQKEFKIWKNTSACNIFTEGKNTAFCVIPFLFLLC